jgi:hypothetical protein
MFNFGDLRAAVTADILTPHQATKLETFLKSRHPAETDANGENLRLLSNFNDLFVTFGIIILFTGLSVLSVRIFEVDSFATDFAGMTLITAPVALCSLIMMEYFCRRRRMLLPSRVLSLIFVTSVTVGFAGVWAAILDPSQRFGDAFFSRGWFAPLNFATALGASAVIFLRYRLPFALFLIALCGAGVAYSALAALEAVPTILAGGMSLTSGLATLVWAIWFDTRDPTHCSDTSDNAFWLHLAAAPQLILGLSILITGRGVMTNTGLTVGLIESAVLLGTLIVLAALALALNRRALIVASLLTFIWALVSILNSAGLEEMTVFFVVTLVIGGGVVLLGAAWNTARNQVLKLLPRQGLWHKVFPPEPVLET